MAAGLSQLLRLGGESELQGRIFRVLSGLLYIGGGIWLVVDPLEGEVSLTLFVGLLLAFEGVMELAAAAAGKGQARGLVLLDGVVTAILGGLLIAEWPTDSLWAVGTLFGIALGFSAVNLLTARPPPARADSPARTPRAHSGTAAPSGRRGSATPRLPPPGRPGSARRCWPTPWPAPAPVHGPGSAAGRGCPG